MPSTWREPGSIPRSSASRGSHPRGYYSDAYFNFTKELLEAENHRPRVLMQVFQKRESLLGGIDEAIAILRRCAGSYRDSEWQPGWDELQVDALYEATRSRHMRRS